MAKRLAEWPDGVGDTSWALCFVSVVPTAGELRAIREAAKLCDRVVAARLTPDRAVIGNLSTVVREAGADVLWIPKDVSGRVAVTLGGVKGVDGTVATLLVQAVTTVLPLAIFADRVNVPLVLALRALQGGLGDMFNLRLVG